MAPPLGSTNAAKHMLKSRAALSGLQGSTLGKPHRQIENRVQAMRRALATAVGELRPLTTLDEAILQSAARHEVRALLAVKWLRANWDMPLADRLALLKTISDATESRDKCLAKLQLDKAAEFMLPAFPMFEPPAEVEAKEVDVASSHGGLAHVTNGEASPTHPESSPPLCTGEGAGASENCSQSGFPSNGAADVPASTPATVAEQSTPNEYAKEDRR